MALAAPLLAPHDPARAGRRQPPAGPELRSTCSGPTTSAATSSRACIHGARVSLLTTLAVGVAILLIGLVVGHRLAGMAGGFVDGLLMRIVDVLLAFPSLLLALAVAGTLGPGLTNLAIAMIAVWWVDYARLVRGLVLSASSSSRSSRPRARSAWARVRIAVRHVAAEHRLAGRSCSRRCRPRACCSRWRRCRSSGSASRRRRPSGASMLNDGKDFLSDGARSSCCGRAWRSRSRRSA